MTKKNVVRLFLLILGIQFLADARWVHAYVDAGTGSYIFQLLIAGLLGGLFFIKNIFRSINGFFKKLFAGSQKAELVGAAVVKTKKNELPE